MPYFNTPSVPMGFTGFCQLNFNYPGQGNFLSQIRTKNFDLK
jgi:hypothetical protein